MRSAAGLLPITAVAALVAWALFFGSSLSDSRLFWIGIFAVAVGFGWLAAGMLGLVDVAVPDHWGLAAFGLLTAFVCWNGVTMIWSITPDLSWAYLNRGAVYLGFALLGLAVAASVRAPARAVAGGLAVLLFGVVGWALLGKVFPSLFPDGQRIARLRNPIGYWNALALACALAVPLGLWIATRRSWRRELRLAGVLLLYLTTIALVLTSSRAGIVVAVVAAVLWLALVPARMESLGTLLVAGAPGAVVAAWASTRHGLVDDGESFSARRAAGGWFALALVLGAVVVVLAALWADRVDRRLEPAERHVWARRIGITLGSVAVVGVLAVTAASGGPGRWLNDFRGGGEVSNTSRLATFSSNNRWEWWKEAWQVFEEKPLGGKGAASFVDARLRVRKGSTVTNEPHNIALQALAETGIVGFLLGTGAVIAVLVAVWRALARVGGEERSAAAALAIAVPSFLLHSLVDIDWDFVAVCAPVFAIGGLLVGIGGEVRELRGRPVLSVALAAAVLACFYSLAAPWLSAARVNDSQAATNPRSAASDARDAASLNPLSVQPIWALAAAYSSVGDSADAGKQYERATRLQPENPQTWVELGGYELCFGDVFVAYRALNHAYTLDRFGPAGIPGGLLDQARAAVEKRGTPSCRR